MPGREPLEHLATFCGKDVKEGALDKLFVS